MSGYDKDTERIAIIKLTYACNNNCIFCHTGGLEKKTFPMSLIQKHVDMALVRNCNLFVFSGGEPTLYPKLPEVLRYVKSRGADTAIVTNGRLLSYEHQFNRIKGYTDQFYISLHSVNNEKHDLMTRVSGSFEQTIRGIKRCRDAMKSVIMRCVVNNYNSEELAGFVEYAKVLDVGEVELSLMQVQGNAEHHWQKLLPRLVDLKGYLEQAMAAAKMNGIEVKIEGIPLCFINGEEEKILKFQSNLHYKFIGAEHESESVLSIKDEIKTRKCLECSKQRVCNGISRKYIEIRGDDELTPLEGGD